MKLLFDQNLAAKLVRDLDAQYPGSKHVRALGLASADDFEVWEYAKTNGFVIVSKDADFHQRSFLLGHPPKVVWVRLGNCSTEDVRRVIEASEADIRAFVEHVDASFLVVP